MSKIPALPGGSGVHIIGDHRSVVLPIRILFIEQLSALIGKSPTTIRTFATSSKYKHLIPPPFKMPGSRRLCWYEKDVLNWIESTQPVEPPPERRPRGRPTKREQQARAVWLADIVSLLECQERKPVRRGPPTKKESMQAAEAGLSVKDWRLNRGML